LASGESMIELLVSQPKESNQFGFKKKKKKKKKKRDDRPTRDPPWCNHFDIGLEAIEGKLETDLIVAFPCAAMRHKAQAR